jgi:hypothetical protein
LVNKDNGKTNYLKLNAQPLLTGFEDLFKTLMVVDMVLNIQTNVFDDNCRLRLNVNYKTKDYWINNLNELLTYYFINIPNADFKAEVENLVKSLRADFSNIVNPGCFINNICPTCQTLGFNRHSSFYSCSNCGTEYDDHYGRVNTTIA